MCRRTHTFAAVLHIIFIATAMARAQVTYRVGAGEKYGTLSAVADMLAPGDTVEVCTDIVDTFTLKKDGVKGKPILIKGIASTSDSEGRRPRITFPQGGLSAGIIDGDWYVIDGLDMSGAIGRRSWGGTILHVYGKHTIIRNCRFHHSNQGIYSKFKESGDILIEFCEFDGIGQGPVGPSVYLESPNPGSTATIRYCYFHDSAGSPFVVSSYPRNVIAYNWFDNSFTFAVKLISEEVGPGVEFAVEAMVRPMHSDILGNVFDQGSSPGSRYAVLHLGGAGPSNPGTEGDFNIAHNLFVMTRAGVSPGVVALVSGNVDNVNLYNNCILRYGGAGCKVYERGEVWSSEETDAFVERRGTGEPVINGSNNWVSVKSTGIPDALTNTFQGLNPKLVDLLRGNYRPRPDSPLAGAGVWPLPNGRVVSLIPEYEPQRGIPVDLTPPARRRMIPPSIGPFEAQERPGASSVRPSIISVSTGHAPQGKSESAGRHWPGSGAAAARLTAAGLD